VNGEVTDIGLCGGHGFWKCGWVSSTELSGGRGVGVLGHAERNWEGLLSYALVIVARLRWSLLLRCWLLLRGRVAEAPGARPCDPEQAIRDGRLSDANRGQAPDRPIALPNR
jgi:hypothetical protein